MYLDQGCTAKRPCWRGDIPTMGRPVSPSCYSLLADGPSNIGLKRTILPTSRGVLLATQLYMLVQMSALMGLGWPLALAHGWLINLITCHLGQNVASLQSPGSQHAMERSVQCSLHLGEEVLRVALNGSWKLVGSGSDGASMRRRRVKESCWCLV